MMKYATPLVSWHFIQAHNYTRATARSIDLIVVHTMEAPQRDGTARSVAAWFASAAAPQASAHYCVDNLEVWQCVREEDVAWAAPKANRNGVHIEHAGYAAQTKEQWASPYSRAMLALSARIAARTCARHSIPVEYVDAAGIVAGHRGVTTHAQVSLAWKTVGGHTDPGKHFPMDDYIRLVRSFIDQGLDVPHI